MRYRPPSSKATSATCNFVHDEPSEQRSLRLLGEGTTVEIEINGMAHVVLTVSDYSRARAFYARLLPAFGMKPVFDGPKFTYFVGARTAIGIEPCDPAYQGERFV